MADTQISQLTAYGTAHGDDLHCLVDVHDTTMASTGTDKKATTYQVFGSPSASNQLIYWSGTSTGVPAGAADITVGANGQVNLASISTPGTQVEGDFWTDATGVCHCGFDGSTTNADCLTYYRSGLIFAQVTAVTVTASGSNTLVSTTNARGTVSLPAGYLNVRGRVLRVRCGGTFTTGAAPGNWHFFAKLGSNCIATTGDEAFLASTTNGTWFAEFDVVTTATGSSGTLNTVGMLMSDVAGGGNTIKQATTAICNGTTAGTGAPGTAVTLDLTQAYTFDWQINMSTASGDAIVNQYLTLEVLG